MFITVPYALLYFENNFSFGNLHVLGQSLVFLYMQIAISILNQFSVFVVCLRSIGLSWFSGYSLIIGSCPSGFANVHCSASHSMIH